MKTIGIDTDNYLIYEGNTFWGHALWPSPSILPAAIVDESNDDLSPPDDNRSKYPSFIFFDDGYDPTSRIRKGRIYQKYEAMQPYQWYVNPHPALHADSQEPNENGVIRKDLATFHEFNYRCQLDHLKIETPLIVLGSSTQFTIWSVIDVETSISGETILFLKARKTIGALPKVSYSVIDGQYHDQIKDKLNLLANEIYKAGPDSIVDRAREAASAIINVYLLSNKHIDKSKDLGQLVDVLNKKAKKYITANCADTLAKFHSRTKHVEQDNKELRPINEQDAELAVQLVGEILYELEMAQ